MDALNPVSDVELDGPSNTSKLVEPKIFEPSPEDPQPDIEAGALSFYLPDPMSSSSVILDPEVLSEASMATTLFERSHTYNVTTSTASSHHFHIPDSIPEDSPTPHPNAILYGNSLRLPMPTPATITIGSAPLLTSPISNSLAEEKTTLSDRPHPVGSMVRSYESAVAFAGSIDLIDSPPVRPQRISPSTVDELRQTLLDETFFGSGGEAAALMAATVLPVEVDQPKNPYELPMSDAVAIEAPAKMVLDSLAKVMDVTPTVVAVKQTTTSVQPEWHVHSEAVREAVEAMWNAEYGRAEEKLKEAGRHRILPRHALHLAEMYMLIQSGTGRDEDRIKVLEYVKVAEAIAARILESKEEFDAAFALHLAYTEGSLPITFRGISREEGMRIRQKIFRIDVEVCHADALLLYGVFQIVTGKEIKGAFNLRKAWKLYTRLGTEMAPSRRSRVTDEERKIVDVEPLARCASFGVAFFQIVMSIVPPAFSSVLKAIGFTVDRDAGTRSLLFIMRSRCVKAPLAMTFLLMDAAFSPFGLLRMAAWNERPKFSKRGGKGELGRPGVVGRRREEEEELGGEGVEWRRVARGVQVEKEGVGIWSNGTLIRIMSHYLLRKLGAIDAAMQSLTVAVDHISAKYAPFPAALLFEMGTLKAVRCEWVAARQIFERLWFGISDLYPEDQLHLEPGLRQHHQRPSGLWTLIFLK
ncbi:hypothetical protein BC829DRAFT_132571 [Chytridium lagenaria]|nr:hypothetical protein BC829DRAFT_132571 [Chytridium lagenaria]